MKLAVDLNSDLGEGAGHDEEMLGLVSSANISCGLHAGDPASVLASIAAAKERGVSLGAHPSFNDRANFGRTEMNVSARDVFALVAYQVGAFATLCTAAGGELNHVKPHGALYNIAARDRTLAGAIAQAVAMVDRRLIVFAPFQSEIEAAARELRLQTAAEVFADRNYNSDGSLVSRTRPDALLRDADEAAERVVRMLVERKVRALDGSDIEVSAETICVHGDTPGAVEFARKLRDRLRSENVEIKAPSKIA